MKKKYDIILFIAVILLITFGLIMIYSASSIWAEYKFNDSFKYVKHQLLFFIVGLILMIKISKIDYNLYYKKYSIQFDYISHLLFWDINSMTNIN